MIGRLRGRVVDRAPDGSVILEVPSGVGYEVQVPMGTLGRVGGSEEEVILFIHSHVREDAFVLFGFDRTQDRDAFRALLGVSGVGPRMALGVVGMLPAEQLVETLHRSDWHTLKKVPGIGKKTAERIVLDLKDKVFIHPRDGQLPMPSAPPPTSAPALSGPRETVIGALVSMGYKPAAADRAVRELELPDDTPVESMLREALKALG